jgi:large subunit ribosomal protein L14
MQAVKANMTKGLPLGAVVPACDNSGAKMLKIFAVYTAKTRKGRQPSAGIADLVMAAVQKGRPDMRKKTVLAIIVRQRKEFRRPSGVRVKFEDNAAIVVKDDKGNPQGSLIKGPVAKEVCERWPLVAKLAGMVV